MAVVYENRSVVTHNEQIAVTWVRFHFAELTTHLIYRGDVINCFDIPNRCHIVCCFNLTIVIIHMSGH